MQGGVLSIFLKIKSWQVFCLVFAIPYSIQLLLIYLLSGSTGTDTENIFSLLPVFSLGSMAISLVWFWALGTGLNNYVASELRLSSKFFRFGVIYSAVYAILFNAVFIEFSNNNTSDFIFYLIVPLHLFAMFCIFYGLYFIATNLVMAEINEVVSFSNYIGTFFLLWFIPVGIWFIQPRINKLYAKHT
jgi:hypothetical protein